MFRTALTASLFLLASAVGLHGQVAGESPSAQDEAESLAREVEAKVAETRGLAYRHPTAVGVSDEADLRDYLGRKIAESLTPQVADAQLRALALIGCYDRDTDIVAATTALLEGQVAGFYEPSEKKLFLVRRGEAAGALAGMDKIIMAHELVHALQDQHFDLEKFYDEVAQDDDMLNARRCLVEGDATWAMLAFGQGLPMTRFLVNQVPDDRAGLLAMLEKVKKMGMGGQMDLGMMGAESLEAAPVLDVDELVFSYYGGARFCLALMKKDDDPKAADLARLDAAFRDPPLSTEQVLHPDKYLGDRDDPMRLELPDLGPVLGDGWTKLAENTFGELRLRSLVRQKGFDRARATRIHSGWDGDRYAVWTKPGEADVLVWASAWDSEKDELDFAAAAVESVLADPAGETGTWSRQGGRRDWQRQAFGLASGLRIGDERGVYLVHQAPAQLREALLNALETGTKWSEIHSTAKDR
ncbi:MAG: hypothetical protein H6807_01955 [Planctomycetes bacterium]|nr:hypothetical protein [Planctomycetota bacterium]